MTIDRILSRPPAFDQHLSSRQSFVVLDELLARALRPLSSEAFAFREFTGEVVAAYAFSRRRLSDASLAALFESLFLDGAPAVDRYMSANVDRGFSFAFLQTAWSYGTSYIEAVDALARSEFGRTSADDLSRERRFRQFFSGKTSALYGALKASHEWATLAASWKGSIIDRYLKHIWSKAVSTERATSGAWGTPFDRADLFSSTYIIASRAADRFVSSHGVFTSYLTRWITNPAASRYANAVGSAFGPKWNRHVTPMPVKSLDDVVHVADAPEAKTADDGVTRRRVDAWLSVDRAARLALLSAGIPPSGLPKPE